MAARPPEFGEQTEEVASERLELTTRKSPGKPGLF
jgi:hypothetical protein